MRYNTSVFIACIFGWRSLKPRDPSKKGVCVPEKSGADKKWAQLIDMIWAVVDWNNWQWNVHNLTVPRNHRISMNLYGKMEISHVHSSDFEALTPGFILIQKRGAEFDSKSISMKIRLKSIQLGSVRLNSKKSREINFVCSCGNLVGIKRRT